MKALTISVNQDITLKLTDKPRPKVGKGQCLIKMHAAAINRRDYWISKGKYPGIKDGVTLGSDGCGEVVDGPKEWLGKKVLVNPNNNWGDHPGHQGEQYHILGLPSDGTFAEYISVNTDRLVEKPGHLTNEEAAAVPLAGLTAYRASFTKAKVKSGDRVLVTGIGGGVSQFTACFAMAAGADVYVSSGSDQKLQKALELGVRGGFNYKEPDWWKQALDSGKFDSIIDSAGGNALNDYLRIIKPGGKIVVYGSTTGKSEGLDVFRLFWSQASIIGSTMGSDDEFVKMVRFVNQYRIKPMINKVWDMGAAPEAVKSLENQEHFGKTVIKIVD